MSEDPSVMRLRRLDICDLSDALDALGLPGAIKGIVPISAGRPIAGRVVTVKLVAGEAPASATRHLCTCAVEAAGPNDLILVEQKSGVDAAGWGGILSRAALKRGIAGTIVDGPARDVEESERIGYTVFARSTTARTARGRIHEADFQIKISFGDGEASPGDYVAADRSGCVLIPQGNVQEVLARAEAIMRRSENMAAAVEAGQPVSKVMSGDYETMLFDPARAKTR
jgi:4-hydroxy-4-methyl-2-oxoglutarate aldolase